MAEKFFAIEIDHGAIVNEKTQGESRENGGICHVEGVAEVAGDVFGATVRAKGNLSGRGIVVSQGGGAGSPRSIVVGAGTPLGGLGRAVVEIFPISSFRNERGGVDTDSLRENNRLTICGESKIGVIFLDSKVLQWPVSARKFFAGSSILTIGDDHQISTSWNRRVGGNGPLESITWVIA